MDASTYIKMLQDPHFFDYKKMEYKYSKALVAEMLQLLYSSDAKELRLNDSMEQPLLYLNHKIQDTAAAMKSLMSYSGNSFYGLTALEDEIISTLSIEQIETSRESVKNILAGFSPQNESEIRIAGMKKGFEFISDKSHTITAESMRELYEIMINPFLDDEKDHLKSHELYRSGPVYVVNQTRNRTVHHGISHTKLQHYMDELFQFIHSATDMNDLNKAAAIHYYIAYLHPYFDGNGRMARMVHLWYLLQHGYAASLFLPFSSIIQKTKTNYYKAFDYTENNTFISGRLDITPFLSYFARDVYQMIGEHHLRNNTLDKFQLLLAEGKITKKESELFHFVLSKYGPAEFSTKQLEKDFANCAYATIRSFVLKMVQEGIFDHHSYGTRNKYCLAAANEFFRLNSFNLKDAYD